MFRFDRDAAGFITDTGEGHMAVQLGRADGEAITVGDWVDAAPAEIATAARNDLAYCGIDQFGDGEVTRWVALSLMPNWIREELVRRVAFDGDRVTLSTPPTPVGGRQQNAALSGNGREARVV